MKDNNIGSDPRDFGGKVPSMHEFLEMGMVRDRIFYNSINQQLDDLESKIIASRGFEDLP